MSWISLALAALFAAVVAVAAGAVLRSSVRQRSQVAAMVLVVGAVLGVAAHYLIVPPLQARYDAGTLDESLTRNAAFAAIKKHDPQTYARLTDDMRGWLLAGKSKADIIDRVSAEVTTLVQKRLPQASNEAATEYMRVKVQEMTELRQRGGDLCYRFLYAKPAQGVDLSKYVAVSTLDADTSTLSQVMRTALVSPQPVPQQAEVAAALKPVFEALAGRHGGDLAMLQNPQAAGADPDKLCAISIDMYSVILQRPTQESGQMIRYLMGQN
ncbi:MAG TPA: hypothetical protein VFL64_00350 [Rhizobacter sp.]|nr:hypothetical protein [Rhizobacter sp.]